jgi:hypothetical protein
MSQRSPLDVLVARTAEFILARASLEDGHGPKPAIEQMLHHLVTEARELELQDVLGRTIYPIKAVAEDSVIDVLHSIDFAPIFITPEANECYAWRWMRSEGMAPSFLSALREVLQVAVVGILPDQPSEEERP